MEEKLLTQDSIENCIACFEGTNTRAFCCKAPICKKCYLEWLKTRRQCMHCKLDQCEFNEWVEKYRQETNDDLDIEQELDIEIIEISLDNTNHIIRELTEHALVNLSNQSIEELINSVRNYNTLFQMYLDIQNSPN